MNIRYNESMYFFLVLPKKLRFLKNHKEETNYFRKCLVPVGSAHGERGQVSAALGRPPGPAACEADRVGGTHPLGCPEAILPSLPRCRLLPQGEPGQG